MAPPDAQLLEHDHPAPPLPPQQPRQRPFLGLGFLSPGDPPETLPPLALPPASEPDESASEDAWQNDEPDDDSSSPEDTSSTGSRAGDRPGLKLGKGALRSTAAKGVRMATGALHQLATKVDSLEREVGLFIADQEDAEAIGYPLADIMSRRGGVSGKALSPDANDALSAVFGLARYISKQIALQMLIAQRQREQAAGPVDV